MKIIQRKLPANCNIFLFGDDHIGTTLRHDSGWRKLCDMMNSEYCGCNANFGIHHGDFIEAIMVDDKRFDMLTTREAFVLQQLELAAKAIEPIKDRLICFLDGNHPRKLSKFGEITKYFCSEKLLRPEIFGTYSAHITYTDNKGRLLFRHFCTHGAGSIKTVADDVERATANMRLSLKRKLKHKFGDTLLMSMGHTHKLIIARPISLLYMQGGSGAVKQDYTAPNRIDGFIHPDYRYYVNTGSFYRLYGDGVSGYGEVANYDPVQLGFAVARVRSRRLIDVDEVRV